MPEFDNEASLREAEAKLPYERVIRELGFGPKNDNWRSFECPFCKKEEKAGVFVAVGSGVKLFKCQSTSCEANRAMPVVKFLGKVRGINNDREAFIEYLKMAGVWRERQKPERLPSPQVTNGDGYTALDDFYSALTLLSQDEERLCEKRGLTVATIERLGFKSNPKSNRRLLLELAKSYAWEELKASGLWLPGKEQKCRRPNSQFCGYIQLARKPKSQRKNPNDKAVWGWSDEGWCSKCEHISKSNGNQVCAACGGKLKSGDAILIPYFSSAGELIALRPHKGGAPEGTAASAMHIYVPRSATHVGEENFPVVIITEGELKAAALWQILGAGRTDGQLPLGIAALPGIYFAKNLAIREELHHWLRAVRCRRVIMAYDYEDKGNPIFKDAYQSDPRKRFDSQIWARYLATDFSRKLHLRGEVFVLPNSWAINGKADWDGALAKLLDEP